MAREVPDYGTRVSDCFSSSKKALKPDLKSLQRPRMPQVVMA